MKRRARPRRPPARRLAPRRLLPALGAAVAALALFAHTERAADRLEASQRLRVVTAVSREMERTGQVPREVVAANLRLLREAGRLDPALVGVPVAVGGQYMLLERYDSAIAVYREALELEPRPETYLNLGNALLASGREAEAREAYRKAVRLAPRLRALVPAGMRPPPVGSTGARPPGT